MNTHTSFIAKSTERMNGLVSEPYAAGPEAEDMAALRRAHPGDEYLEPMRAVLGATSSATRP